MRESGSRGLMANPCAADKCVNATAAMHTASNGGRLAPTPLCKGGEQALTDRYCFFSPSALALAALLHSRMNGLRSFLPWRFLASASAEHAMDSGLRGFSALFAAGSAFSAGVAGADVWANAEPISRRDATAVAATREDNVIMGNLGLRGAQPCAAMLNRG
jgi:hypothetical protein